LELETICNLLFGLTKLRLDVLSSSR